MDEIKINPPMSGFIFIKSTIYGFKLQLDSIEMTTSDIIAICSLFTAAFALFATTYQAFLSRRHNILSVRPHVEPTLIASFDNNYQINLRNNGLGFALIKKLNLKIPYQNYSFLKLKDIEDLIAHINKSATEVFTVGYTVIEESISLSPGQELCIFEIEESSNHIADIKEIMANAKIEIEYICMYEKSYKVNMSLS